MYGNWMGDNKIVINQGKTGQWNYIIVKNKFEKWLKNN